MAKEKVTLVYQKDLAIENWAEVGKGIVFLLCAGLAALVLYGIVATYQTIQETNTQVKVLNKYLVGPQGPQGSAGCFTYDIKSNSLTWC